MSTRRSLAGVWSKLTRRTKPVEADSSEWEITSLLQLVDPRWYRVAMLLDTPVKELKAYFSSPWGYSESHPELFEPFCGEIGEVGAWEFIVLELIEQRRCTTMDRHMRVIDTLTAIGSERAVRRAGVTMREALALLPDGRAALAAGNTALLNAGLRLLNHQAGDCFELIVVPESSFGELYQLLSELGPDVSAFDPDLAVSCFPQLADEEPLRLPARTTT